MDFKAAGPLSLNLRENVCLMAALNEHAFDHETDLLISLLRPGDVVYDIGANFGWTAVVAARAVGSLGHVYAFEPASPAYQLLTRNVGHRRNVSPYRLALGACRKKAEFYVTERLDLSSLTANVAGDRVRAIEEVEVWRLDDFIEHHELVTADVIKCDVEGGEVNVIIGATKALSAGPLFIFEYVERFSQSNGFTLDLLLRTVLAAMPKGTVIFRVIDKGKLTANLAPWGRGANNYVAVSPKYLSRIEGLWN